MGVRGGVEGVVLTVVAVEEEGAFVNVRVAGEDEIDAAGFEDGEEVLTHLDELAFAVGIVGALGVGGMVKEGYDLLGTEAGLWLTLLPGIAISLLVLSFNLLGNGLRDAYDPKTPVMG